MIKKSKRFPFQRDDEDTALFLRRHWIIRAKYVSRLVLFHLVPVIISIFLFGVLEWDIPDDGLLYIISVLFVSLYFLFIWLFYFHEFVDFQLDFWIVTNERIINIEQAGLFNRTIAELDILNIQDVTVVRKGKIQTFLNYGDVHIQTAGEAHRFVFKEIAHPEAVAQVITRTQHEAMKKSGRSS